MAKLILKTDKKKLEIKKSSIINFTLNELQMGLIVGGVRNIHGGSKFMGEGDCTIRTHTAVNIAKL